jgi:hypothetical protein
MAKRTDLTVTEIGGSNGTSFVPQAKDEKAPEEVAALKGDIEQTRGQMSRTVDEIEQRLSPAKIKEQIAGVKESIVAQYHDAKDHIKEDIVSEVREAKDKVKEEIGDAKQLVQEQLTHAKDAVVDATVGRVKEIAADAGHAVEAAGDKVKEIAVDAGHAMEVAGGKVKDVAVDAGHAVGAAGSSVLATIRRNPVPVALLAVGAGWLAMSLLRGGSQRQRQLSYDGGVGRGGFDRRPVQTSAPSRDILHRVGDTATELGQQVSDTASQVGHTVSDKAAKLGHTVTETAQGVRDRAMDAVHGATDTVSELGHRVSEGAAGLAHDAEEVAYQARDRAVELAHDAGEGLYRAEETLEETYVANPLPFGAVALAVGAAIGLALPHTEREDAWMGEAKDRLLKSAGEMAKDAIHTVQEQTSHLTEQQA